MKKILVIRYRFIGDTLLSVPFLRNLRYNYPDAQIDMLVSTGSGEILEDCPYVNNLIFFDTTKKFEYETGEKKSFWGYVKLLRKEKYDKIYVLKRSLSSAIFAFLSGAKERIGFDTECRGFLLTKKVPYNKNKHEIESFLDILRADNLKVEDTYLENFIDEKTEDKIKAIFEENGIKDAKKVVIHATASTPQKEWTKEKWAKIIEYISNEKNAQILFLGTKNDANKYKEILSCIKSELKIKPVNFCGKFNLKESLSAIKHADLMIGIDSGNLHMAASVKTRVIGLYGPMNEKKWGAYPCKSGTNILLTAEVECRPCGLKKKCKNNLKCLTDITVEQVKKAIDKIF
ncbi:lipopolysaccharide heptosyltransferase II [bacterium]|nr:lipopolysaccharide heptosyltransferase II [bacterium]